MDTTASIKLIMALTECWTAIQKHHPGVPDVVLLPAPSLTRRLNVLGHFAPLRWRPREQGGALLHEVVVVAEHLNRNAADIFETLLHEAAHAFNFDRGIRDCSRSQYHNRKFKAAAEELGLEVVQVRHYGYALTTLAPATTELYKGVIKRLDSVLIHRRAFRQKTKPPGDKPSGPGANGRQPDDPPPRTRSRKATCACGFIIRVSKKTIENTVIRCESCGVPFQLAGS